MPENTVASLPSGQVMLKADAAQAHRLIGVHPLFATGTIRLETPVGPLTFRAHPDTVRDLRALVEAGVRSDAEFRHRLKREAQRTILLGLALFLGAWPLFGFLIVWARQLPEPKGLQWLWAFFAARLLRIVSFLILAAGFGGPYWVYLGIRQLMRLRRIEHGSAADWRAGSFPREPSKPKPAEAK